MINKLKSWFSFPDDLVRQMATAIIAVGIFTFGMVIGASLASVSIKANLYEEALEADNAIWLRIDTIENDKRDLFERMDYISRLIDQFDLAVAQIKVYENRQEIMNVRMPKDD